MMNISPYMDINRLELVVTWQCSGACRHCSVGDTRDRAKGSVPEAASVEALQRLAGAFDLGSVMTFGGEPLLYPETTAALHAKAAALGIPKRQLITNGFFSRDPERQNAVAKMLKKAGVNDLLLSVDAFHQEHIPLDAVRHFAQCAQGCGLPIRLHPAWVVNRENDNRYNAETRAILESFADLNIPVSYGNDIFLSGNAAKHLSSFYETPAVDLSGFCGDLPYTGPLTGITSLSVVPGGDVTVCDFVIGNILTEDILDIVARYDPYENAYMRALVEGGGNALAALAEENGIPVDYSQCHSVCDICHQVTAHISA